MKCEKVYLYHLRQKGNSDLSEGYIGVCNDLSKRRYKHFNTPVNPVMAEIISYGIPLEMVVLVISTRENCLLMEEKLRPETNIGWNTRAGGLSGVFCEESKLAMAGAKIGNSNVGSGEDHPFFGKTGKNVVRYGTEGEKSPLHKGYWITPEGNFPSMALASKANGVAKSTVHYRCITSNNHSDWYFVENKEK